MRGRTESLLQLKESFASPLGILRNGRFSKLDSEFTMSMQRNRKITPKAEPTEDVQNTVKQRCDWTVSEKKALAAAIRTYGFSDIRKIANVVKTRSCSDIEMFMNHWKNRVKNKMPSIPADVTAEVKPNKTSEKQNVHDSQLPDTPAPVEYWIRAIKDLIQSKFRPNDYSDIFENIFRSAATCESHVEPRVAGEPNFKDIYTFFASILAGSVSPPLLSTVDRTVVAYLIGQLGDFIETGDWQEEKACIEDVHLPTEFVCLGNDNTLPDVGLLPLTVERTSRKAMVSNDLYTNLNCHKKIQENLNPMCIPLKLLKKEQKEIKKYLASE